MLEVLQQKTEGNRTPEESEDIEAMLYQFRMAYVQRRGEGQSLMTKILEFRSFEKLELLSSIPQTPTSGPGRIMGGASYAEKPIPDDLRSLPVTRGIKGNLHRTGHGYVCTEKSVLPLYAWSPSQQGGCARGDDDATRPSARAMEHAAELGIRCSR